MESRPRLLYTPPEIASHILVYLDWRDALRLASVAPLYRKVLQTHSLLWRRYYQEEFLRTEQDKTIDAYLRARIVIEERVKASSSNRQDKSIEWDVLFRRQILLHQCWRQGQYKRREIDLPGDGAEECTPMIYPIVLGSNVDYSVVYLRPGWAGIQEGELYIVSNTPDHQQAPVRLASLGRPGLLNKLTFFSAVPSMSMDREAVVLIIRTSAPMQVFLCAWNPNTGRLLVQTAIPDATTASVIDRRGRWLLVSVDGDRWRLYDLQSLVEGQPIWSARSSGGMGFCMGYDIASASASASTSTSVTANFNHIRYQGDWIEVVRMSKSPTQPACLSWHSFICRHGLAEDNVQSNVNTLTLKGIVRTIRRFNWKLLCDADRLVMSVLGQHGEQVLVVASRYQNNILWSNPQREASVVPIYLSSCDLFVMQGWIEQVIKDDNTGRIVSRRRSAGHLVLNAQSGHVVNTLTDYTTDNLIDIGLGAFLLVQSPVRTTGGGSDEENGMRVLNAKTGRIVSRVRHLPEYLSIRPGATHFISYDSDAKKLYLYDFAMDEL